MDSINDIRKQVDKREKRQKLTNTCFFFRKKNISKVEKANSYKKKK